MQNYLSILPHVTIEQAHVNLDVVAQSTNAQSIVPVLPKAIESSNAEKVLTARNDQIIELKDSDSENDSVFSIDSRKTLDW